MDAKGRMHLMATSGSIALQPLNQPVERVDLPVREIRWV